MTVRAPVGDLAINDFESCIGRGVCSIKGNKFIYYFLQTLKDKHTWEKLSQGSTFESINSNDIKNLNFKIPSEKTQNSISNFLSLIDGKIQLLEEKHEYYINFKKYLMQQIFAQKLRFADYNDEWRNMKVGDCLDVRYGKDYKHLNEGKYPVLGTGGVMEYVDDFLYSGESILIGRKGTINKPMYINGSFWTVDTLFYTKIKKGFPKFLFYYLSNINWLKYNEASGVPSLSANNIKNIKINILV